MSRRTDIPAFYGDWFMNRLNEGFVGYVNPFGGSKHFVSLLPEDVVCFVLWSKNFKPFIDHLKEIQSRAYNCYFQFTINNLPKIFESNVVEATTAIEILKEISRMYSTAHINWRYDPIIISDITNADFHLKNFSSLASKLEGYVERCYFSFPTFYGKVKRNISVFEKENGFPILNSEEDFRIKLANRMSEIAYQHGITMNSCCGDYLVGGKIEKAHCVDGDIIGNLFMDGDTPFKIKPSRAECGCAESTDIGVYDTCPNGCIYCYANVNKQKAQVAFENHDPRSAFLGHSFEESERWIIELEKKEKKELPPTKNKRRKIISVNPQELRESRASNMPSEKTGISTPKIISWEILASALQKTIRWCEVNDARYFAQKLIEMGQPGRVFRRLIVAAMEDVGLADPTLAKYIWDCLHSFKTMVKEHKAKVSKVSNFPEICVVIDRAVIAAALAYKSRLLPMLLFVSLYDIYQKEDFSHDLRYYERCFRTAIQNRDEKKGAYYACILALIFDSGDSVIEIALQESKAFNIKALIEEWIQIYKDEDAKTKKIKEDRLTLIGIVSLFCRNLNYSHGEYRAHISDWLSKPIERVMVPDRAYDMHTLAKKTKGRGLEHFFKEAASVKNERFPNDWKERGEKAYFQAREEGLEKADKMIEAIKEKVKKIQEEKTTNALPVNLPFKYKKAILTQARTSRNRPFAFIVEFHDGSRKFMKGPFNNIEPAQDHVIYNEIKKRLNSNYLHPIKCALENYGPQLIFLSCQEIGKADLDNVEEKETRLDGTFVVLSYESNDVVPDPLNFLIEINKENQQIWIEMIVNYCFRWIFGLGDAAPRNLMLEKSTGKIYSTDEIFLRSNSHEDIWGGKRPAKEKFELIKTFIESNLLNEVLREVEGWKNSINSIRREFAQISEDVEKRMGHFLSNPMKVLGVTEDLESKEEFKNIDLKSTMRRENNLSRDRIQFYPMKGENSSVSLDSANKKYAFTYEGKTGIAETKGFQKKQLADFACNIGNICHFGCTFCYVPSVVTKQKGVQNILKQGHDWNEVSHYRTKENLIKCVERDLKKIKPGDRRVVIFCTTCDPCATEEHADITSSAIRMIMQLSNLKVRVLSKSTLIGEIAKELDEYRERIIYGLSTGTIRPEISASIEGNASPVLERIKTFQFLQNAGYRTFGMLCPIIPSELPYLKNLVEAINPNQCEHIWAEALNVRGKSLVKTRDQLKEDGLEEDALLLEKVMGNKSSWRDYAKDLFFKVREELEEHGVAEKLRYLQYVTREPGEFVEFFASQEEAICL